MAVSTERLHEGGVRHIAWADCLGRGTFLLFLIILLHEFGHCFAARKVGGRADDVLLWPLGGLAFTQYAPTWRNSLIVVGGGPMVNVVIALIAIPAFLIFGPTRTEIASLGPTGAIAYVVTEQVLVEWNLIMLVFNLIPLYPLDGGQLFRAALWGWFERKGGFGDGPFYKASQITIPVSFAIGAIGILVSLWLLPAGMKIFGVAIFAWAMMNTWQLKKQLEQMRFGSFTERSEFGYDFSQGYTSLAKGPAGGATRTEKRASARQQRKDQKTRQKKSR